MGQDKRVVVRVDDPAGRADLLGDLVGRAGRGEASTDVEELAYAQARGGVPGDPLPEHAVRPGPSDDLRPGFGNSISHFAVGWVVVFAA